MTYVVVRPLTLEDCGIEPMMILSVIITQNAISEPPMNNRRGVFFHMPIMLIAIAVPTNITNTSKGISTIVTTP